MANDKSEWKILQQHHSIFSCLKCIFSVGASFCNYKNFFTSQPVTISRIIDLTMNSAQWLNKRFTIPNVDVLIYIAHLVICS